MFALVLVAGIALTFSGVIVGILQSRHLKDTTENQLRRVEGELRALATDGVDPETKELFNSAPQHAENLHETQRHQSRLGGGGFHRR